ncbi:hypothetical protein CC2G_006346 [Coprinopsis cinerea AmutBmut pab1-1]|nr:hypothetical protein CC2G_006346 [Coprinopsis cinerea AmutBmut pab1-1]
MVCPKSALSPSQQEFSYIPPCWTARVELADDGTHHNMAPFLCHSSIHMVVRGLEGLLGIKIPLLSAGGTAESTSPVVIRLAEGNFVARPGSAWFGHNAGIFFNLHHGFHWLLKYEWESEDEDGEKSVKIIDRLNTFVTASGIQFDEGSGHLIAIDKSGKIGAIQLEE